jgi:cyclic-di-GMP phosphodiesterase TipF (flagellum assembly factor)
LVRISAVFIAVCMMLIAASVGFVVYIRFGLSGAESFLIGLGVLTALAVYNAVAGRGRDRSEVSSQMASLSRGSADLAHQLAEFGVKLSTMEGKVDAVLDKALATAQPLAAEIEELSTLVKRLADQVAAHETALSGYAGQYGGQAGQTGQRSQAGRTDQAVQGIVPQPIPAATPGATVVAPVSAAGEAVSAASAEGMIPAFAGLDAAGAGAVIEKAIDRNTVDLYLQPIVTLPQRKVRYYEALSRLKTDDGELVAAGDFIKFAEAGGLMPKLDKLSVLRCVQVVRRLLLKNRDIGLFCNLSTATLTDSGFPQLLEFVEANRAIAPALVFEFTQSAVRAMGPMEHEALAAMAERGFRFSMDNLSDLRIEPRELTQRGFRFIKVPATLLLNRGGAASTDIHPADMSDLLGRFGIDLIAEKIEAEGAVVDLLDYDVRFGQGFLFSPPRPVRAEALQGVEPAKFDADKNELDGVKPKAGGAGRVLAQIARAAGRSG